MQQPSNKLGFGLGLRTEHYEAILNEHPAVDWFEALTENYLVPGGKPLHYLDEIRKQYPIALHGVSMSIGSTDPLDLAYLQQLKSLINRVEPVRVSDHLCWTGVHGKNMHDLLPLPYTEESVAHIASRITQIQEYLGHQILIENVSSYVTFQQSVMTEWDFLNEICSRADCHLLLDVNNIYVSAFNHQFDPIQYINAMPSNRIKQIHLAGHTNNGDHIIDTHDHDIIKPVWDLYAHTIAKHGYVPTMIERDDNIPPLNELVAELNTAKKLAKSVLLEQAI